MKGRSCERLVSMCRIAGIISNRLTPEKITEHVLAMCSALKHGGPDDQGIFTDEKAGLSFGHRRLSIIDLSGNGHQPMSDGQKMIWITFNGEIYNYLEVKDQLIKKGVKFKNNTDTEVILQAYKEWGTRAFSILRGMFAFAIYDAERAITYLVRDTTGVKPLYYHIQNGQLSFASEVQALKKAGIANEVDTSWQVRLLAFGHIPEPYTTLKKVFSLPKGHFLAWNHQNNSYYVQSFACNLPEVASITNINLATEHINAGLKAAIKRQLIADAEIGVFFERRSRLKFAHFAG